MAKYIKANLKNGKLKLVSFIIIFAVVLSFLTPSFLRAEPVVPVAGDPVIMAETPKAIKGGQSITEGGVYNIERNGGSAEGVITIATTASVTLVGTGTTEADAYASLTIKCDVAGVNLTIKDLYIKNNVGNLIDLQGAGNFVYFSGTNVLEQLTNAQGLTIMHVGPTTELTLGGVTASDVLYFYKSELGAGIGGKTGEYNGKITITKGRIFGKGTKQGAVIGSGQNAKTSAGEPNSITIEGGELNLIANARGALIGGSAGSAGGTKGANVYVKGGTLNLNVDFSGAAIGGGGYDSGNDSSGGNMIYTGGSLRTFINQNAVDPNGNGDTSYTLWPGVTQAGVNDTAITANKVNTSDGKVYLMAFDTTMLTTSATTFTVLDGVDTIYSGGLHSYSYVNENLPKNQQKPINTTKDNWEPDVDNNLYFYMTGENHIIDVNGEQFKVTYNASAVGEKEERTGGVFTVTPLTIPDLNVSETSLGFGNAIIGTLVPEKDVTISGTNLEGDINYSIGGADASAFSISEKSWSASAGGTLGITFTPTESRSYNAMVTITSSNATTKTIALTGSGLHSELNVAPESVSFGDIFVGTPSSEQDVMVSGANLSGNISYSISGADASAFNITEKSWSASAGGKLGIIFTPTESRSYNAVVTLTSNNAESKEIALTGSGIQSGLSVSPGNIPFEGITVNTSSSEQNVTISGVNLTDNISYSISGADANAFSITEKSWSASAGGKLGIIFNPTQIKNYNAVITVTSNGADSKTINLTGNGKAVVWDVTFKGMDGNTIATVQVEDGSAAVLPIAPEVSGYAFTGWNVDTSNVTSNMEVTALYIELPQLLFPSGSKYTQGSTEGFVAKVEKDMVLFSHVELDGVKLPENAFVVTEGSTVVTIQPAYLNQLTAGIHELKIHFTDGSWAVATFEMMAAASNGGGQNNNGQSQTPGKNAGSNDGSSTKSVKMPKTHNGSLEVIVIGTVMMAAGLLWMGSKKYFNKDK